MVFKTNRFFRRRTNSPTPVVVDVAKMSSFNYPYTPREPSTVSIRSTSLSSLQSSASSTRQSSPSRRVSHDDLQNRAISILNTLSSSPDYSPLYSYISDSVVVQHNDDDPTSTLAEFLDHWEVKRNRCPHLKIDIKEALVDETQRKVWVRSEISGKAKLEEGLTRESVKMMTFDEDCVLTRIVDTIRVQKKDD